MQCGGDQEAGRGSAIVPDHMPLLKHAHFNPIPTPRRHTAPYSISLDGDHGSVTAPYDKASTIRHLD